MRRSGDDGESGEGEGTDDAFVPPVEDAIDLHTFRPRDIPDVVRDYLEAARAKGFAEVRLIHGRGTGLQRERVRAVLASHPAVASFRDAPPSRGHWGATLVRLVPGASGVPPE